MVSFRLPFRRNSAASFSTVSAYPPPGSRSQSDNYRISESRPNFLQRLLPSWPSRLYLGVLLLQTVAGIGLEAYFLSKTDWHDVIDNVGETEVGSTQTSGGDRWKNQQMEDTLPVYLSVFVVAHLFQLVIALDGMHAKNTIQIIGLCAFNAGFAIESIVQVSELIQYKITTSNLVYVIPSVIAVAEIFYVTSAWYIYKEFGWQVYKKIGADRRMKKVYMWWEIFICLLKFDFFFWVAFCIQLVLLVLPGQGDTVEYYITMAAAPFLFLALAMGYLAARKEWKVPMWIFLFGCLGAIFYFGFKIFRIFERRTTEYAVTWQSMLVFATLSLFTALGTFVTAIICLRNFGVGLTHYIDVPKSSKEAGYGDEDVRPMRPVHSVPLYGGGADGGRMGHGKYDSYVSASAEDLKSGGLRRNDTRMSID